LKRTITKRHKRNFTEREGSLETMLPDGPPPVPKHKYFKKLIKPKITFGFFYLVIHINRHAAAYILFGF
jgi:hypothetical protein